MLGYTTHGLGPHPVIVMHDWLGSHHNYMPLIPYLDLDFFTYTFVDLRGYGLSKDQKGNYTTVEAANDVLDVAAHLNYEKFHLIGHSMTGQVGLQMMALHPDRVLSFISIAGTSACGAKIPDEMRAGIKKALESQEGREGLLSMMWSGRLSDQWRAYKIKHWMNESTVEAAQGYLDMFGSEDISSEVGTLTTPMLVIGCDDDMEGFRLENLKEGYTYPNVQFALCQNSSHYPMQEVPVYLATIMERFLKEQI